MTKSNPIRRLLALAALAALPASALADSQDAFCEVREHGEEAKNASGYCTVSQRQGNIGIRLANGESFDLQPGPQAGRYEDQEGRGVDHEVKKDGSHYYKWEHRNITVYFNPSEGQYH